MAEASHFAYGNDYFCTADRAKGAGKDSVLHPSNYADLAIQGVNVIAPTTLEKLIL